MIANTHLISLPTSDVILLLTNLATPRHVHFLGNFLWRMRSSLENAVVSGECGRILSWSGLKLHTALEALPAAFEGIDGLKRG